MFDVVAIGELLIDFTFYGNNDSGTALFARNPGGAPANALAANSRLGGKTAFIGKVGNDDFGRFLKQTLEDSQIDTSGLAMTDQVHTTLAFVQLDQHGDRSFSFYRKPGADIMLTADELNDDLLSNTHILHFGSVSMTEEPSRGATMAAVTRAKEKGAIISYDPNFRAPLWENTADAVRQMTVPIPLADLIKVSEEELYLLTGEKDLERGAGMLLHQGVSLVMVTLGPDGAFYKTGACSGLLPAYDVATVDTNGAGDAFTGGVHYCLRNKSLTDIRNLSRTEMDSIIRFGNAVGSLTTTRGGAIPALPTLQEVQALLAENKTL